MWSDADLAETETARECKIFKNIHANILNLYTVIAAFMCIILVMTVPYQGQDMISNRPTSSNVFDQIPYQWN